jgi:hypothetical protein
MLRKKKVVTIRWFDPDKDIVLNHFGPEVEAWMLRLNKLSISEADAIEEVTRQKKTLPADLSLSFVANLLQQRAQKPLESPAPKLNGAHEIMTTAILHFLLVDGFVTAADLTLSLSAKGRAYLKFTNPAFQEQGLALIDLLVMKVVSSEALAPSTPIVANSKEIALISRLFSFLNATYSNSETPWNGPLDKDLMGFNSIVRTHVKALRNLAEMTLARLYFGGDLLKLSDYSVLQRVSDVLPFGQESSTSLGLIAKFKLQNPTINPQVRFPNCTSIASDLKTAYSFWTQAMEAVKSLNEDKLVEEGIFKDFVAANAFLEARIKDDSFYPK